jgi:hypothetical protein
MDFVLIRGKPFAEHFDFKNAKGRSLVPPEGLYRLVVEHGDFVREYRIGRGLTKTRSAINWNLAAKETADFEYSTMYYTLYLDSNELARGVLRIQ